MAAVFHSPPTHSPSSLPSSSPYGRVSRQSPLVQELQSAPNYVDIYTGSPLAYMLKPKILAESQVQADRTTISHAHPEPVPLPRWRGPIGPGARHINDNMPFTLWNEEKRDFRDATTEEKRFIDQAYKAERLIFDKHLLVVETSDPPKPIPITVAGMPAIFVPIGYKHRRIAGETPYIGSRLQDPCPHLSWGGRKTPEASIASSLQEADIISVLLDIVNVDKVHFLPASIVVEIVFGDGRTYEDRSLPPKVAGLWTTYHHSSVPFFASMKNHTRERLVDPGKHLPGPAIGPLPQDGTNYLREPAWHSLCPGARLSTGLIESSGEYASLTLSTTCGISLRKGSMECVTAAFHAHDRNTEVFHPSAEGDKIGDVVDQIPELDIALVKLTPSINFSNRSYFQAEPPRRLVGESDITEGAWFEVDGMSTGLLTFCVQFKTWAHPTRPPGHPKIPVIQWTRDIAFRVFGATSPDLMDGLCGAPFVEERTGNVAGFFHLADGDFAVCATLDDLIAEGWQVT